MLIALSKGGRHDPLTEAQRGEVELFLSQIQDKPAQRVLEALATLAMPAVWHALGTGDSAALAGYDVPRLHAETMRITDELPELLTLDVRRATQWSATPSTRS